jgi:hypothetical protein
MSMKKMAENYSQPINPKWRTLSASHCQKHLKKLLKAKKKKAASKLESMSSDDRAAEIKKMRSAIINSNRFACSKKRLTKRMALHKKSWCELSKSARNAAALFAEGYLPNTLPGLMHFAASTIGANRDNNFRVVGCSHSGSTNSFYINEKKTFNWSGDESFVEMADDRRSLVLIPQKGVKFCGKQKYTDDYYTEKRVEEMDKLETEYNVDEYFGSLI